MIDALSWIIVGYCLHGLITELRTIRRLQGEIRRLENLRHPEFDDDPNMPDGWPDLNEIIEVVCLDEHDDCPNSDDDPWCRARVVKRRATGSIGWNGRCPYIVAEFIDHTGRFAVEDEGLTFRRIEENA